MGIPVTAGFHLQPENVLYSAGPLRHIPGISSFLYWLFKHWLYKRIDHIHVPTEMTASLLRAHGYKAKLHVISNGYSPVYSPKKPVDPEASAPVPFRVIASGRLASEKDQITLIKAVSMSKHAGGIQLIIAGTGPLKQYLRFRAGRLLARKADIGFHKHADMPDLLRSGDLFVHCSIADIESVSVIEAMACGLVPVIAASELSAASSLRCWTNRCSRCRMRRCWHGVSIGGSNIRLSVQNGVRSTPNTPRRIIPWKPRFTSSWTWNAKP